MHICFSPVQLDFHYQQQTDCQWYSRDRYHVKEREKKPQKDLKGVKRLPNQGI